MVDGLAPNTPEWWVKRLDAELRRRRLANDVTNNYYDGKHRLRFTSPKFVEAFGDRFGNMSDNWCAIVVDAVAERLKVNGFRLGKEPGGDDDFWRIWQRSQMDAESKIGFVEALVTGDASILVWGKDGEAELTVESSDQMVVATAPGRRRERLAAWKVYRDDFTGHLFGVLYLPRALYKFASRNPVDADRSLASDTTQWVPREVRPEAWPLPNPLRLVPVVPLRNRPRLRVASQSELASTIPMQDVANKLLADLLIGSEYQSFRQRWVTGMDIPIDPVTQKPIEPFKSAVDRLWMSESESTTFGEFGEITLTGYIGAIELAVQHIASQSRTPPHYFYLKGNLPSGESIKSAETGLVAKSREKMLFLGEDLEEVARLAFLVEREDGKAKAAITGETIWADPEYRTEGEHVDAVLKKKALGVPEEMLWEELGMTPTEIARAKALKAKAALELAAAGIPPRPVLEVAPNPNAPMMAGNPSGNGAVPAPAGATTG